MVDARLLRLPHGRRGRSGHALAAATSVSRLVRPVTTRRRRSGDRVASRERRNRQAARATRCDALSPQSIADPAGRDSFLARGTRQSIQQWRAAPFGACPPRNAFSGMRQKKVLQCTPARASAHVRPRTRLESRRETRTRCGGYGTRPFRIRVRALGPRGASPARTSRVRGFPAIPKRAFLFRGRDASPRRTRESRSCDRAFCPQTRASRLHALTRTLCVSARIARVPLARSVAPAFVTPS